MAFPAEETDTAMKCENNLIQRGLGEGGETRGGRPGHVREHRSQVGVWPPGTDFQRTFLLGDHSDGNAGAGLRVRTRRQAPARRCVKRSGSTLGAGASLVPERGMHCGHEGVVSKLQCSIYFSGWGCRATKLTFLCGTKHHMKQY